MTDKPHYPSIGDATLVPFRALEVQLKSFPDLLDRDECPYPPHIRQLVRRLVGEPGVGPPETREYGDDELILEITDLYNDLKRAGMNVKASDPKDQIAMFKTSADLLTKMVALKERAMNVREMSQFQKVILAVMEQVLTPAQRSEYVEIMGKHLNV